MSNTPVSGLTALAPSALDAGDYIPTLDSSASTLKKLLASALALSDGGAKTSAFTAAPGYLYRLDLSTPPTSTFTAATSDVVTFATLTPIDGMKVQVASSTTLPAGLSASTTYYTRDSSGSTCKLAATLGGSAIDITSTGTGTHTATFGILPTFPASPSVGDRFGYVLSRSHAIYDVLPNRNGSSIMGGTDPQPYLLYIQSETTIWRYDTTSSGLGWFLEQDGRISGHANMYKDAAQSITGQQAITLDTALIDIGGICSTSANKMIIRRSGRYSIRAGAVLQTTGTNKVHQLGVRKNGSDIWTHDLGTSASLFVIDYTENNPDFAFIPGDYLQLYFYNDNAGATALYTASSGGVARFAPFLSAQEIVR